MKRCAKCDGPIPSPVLGDDPGERCPLCGDEPASRAELAGLLRAALHGGVVAIHRYLDGMGEEGRNGWEQEAWEALDAALDDVDGAVRTFESEDPYCRTCGSAIEPDSDDDELWQHIDDGAGRCMGPTGWVDVEPDQVETVPA